jgi:hypothetical protein
MKNLIKFQKLNLRNKKDFANYMGFVIWFIGGRINIPIFTLFPPTYSGAEQRQLAQTKEQTKMQLLIPKQKIQDFVIKNWTWILSLAFLLMILLWADTHK